MRRFEFVALLLLLSSTVVVTISGCKKQDADEDVVVEPYKYRTGGGATAGKAAEPIKTASMDGVITGRVVYDGTPPEMAKIAAIADHKDASGCLAGAPFEERQQTWIIGKDNTVGNVVVWMAVPKGKFFELTEEDKDRSKETIILDQPHCAFIPHVLAVYPSYFDGKAQQPTGQVFKAKNSAGFTHNTRYAGSDVLGNRGNVTLASGADTPISLIPALPTKSGKDMVGFGCDVHPWMNAKGFVFDHPYHDVTRVVDEKRPDGAFELKNVPTGVDINLVFWHEAKGEFKPVATFKLSPGEKKDLGDVKVK